MIELERIIKCVEWLIFERKVKSRRDLANIMGYTESSISQILNNKVALSSKFIKKLANTDNSISETWLLTGEGEMLKTVNSELKLDNNEITDKNRLLAIIEHQQQMLESQQRIIDKLVNK